MPYGLVDRTGTPKPALLKLREWAETYQPPVVVPPPIDPPPVVVPPVTPPADGEPLPLARLQVLAAGIATVGLPADFRYDGSNPVPGWGTFDAWAADKTVGTLMSRELAVADADGGGVAVITATGRLLRWRDGAVEVL